MRLNSRSLKDLCRFLAPSAGGPVADRALAEGLITPAQLEECAREQDRTGRPLDDLLVERGYLKAEDRARLRRPALPPEVVAAAADPRKHVSHYVIVSLIGKGGMSEVWKAWDHSLGRWAALKLLKPGVGHPSQRLEREGRMAGGLAHPNIITIFERGEHEGRPFLAMPFVDGRPPQAPLPAREAARIVRELAEALAYVHRQGLIHRDVKPGNVLIDAQGRPLLTDFGLAIPDGAGGSPWALSGTPEYASPEQIRGEPLDARTDVYSLGATLFYILTGRHPFSGADSRAVAEQVLQAPIPPLPETPTALARIVRRAMDRDPSRRYPSMEAMAADLARFLERPRRRISFDWPVVAGGALLVAVLSSVATWFMLEKGRAVETAQAVHFALQDARGEMARVRELAGKADAPAAEVRAALIAAIRAYNKVIDRAGGRHPEASAGLGRCYEFTGQPEWAEESYLQAGAHPEARLGLARIWLRRDLEGRSDRDWRARALEALRGLEDPSAAVLRLYAEGRWEEAVAKGKDHPADEFGVLALGRSAMELGRWDEALSFLDRGIGWRRSDPDLWFLRGAALSEKGDRAAASASYARALEVAPPGWPLRAEAMKRLGDLRK